MIVPTKGQWTRSMMLVAGSAAVDPETEDSGACS
jgi:hypothetical protein